MDPADIQIQVAFKELKLTPEQIAADFGYELAAVKLSLAKSCPESIESKRVVPEFGMPAVKVDEPLFTGDDLKLAKNTIVNLAAESDVDAVKLKAAVFIINESKGRNDVKSLIEATAGTNIAMINEMMTRAREAMNRTRARAGKVIDVEQKVA